MQLCDLPDELLIATFSWLPPTQVFRFSRLDSRFNKCLLTKHFVKTNLSRFMIVSSPSETKSFDADLDAMFLHSNPLFQLTYAESVLNRFKEIDWSGTPGTQESKFKLPAAIASLTKVVNLDISYCELQGDLPVEIGAMAKLEELFLFNNALAGTIPAQVSRLGSLRVLDLSSNLLGGCIPHELGLLTNLQCLYLSQNRLEGCIPPSLFTLSQLRDLYLDRNQLSGSIPNNIDELVNVRWLHLYRNRLEGVVPVQICRLRYLESCELRGNPGLAMEFEWEGVVVGGDVDELE
ncbi:hypothetical protein HDU98_004978 [Podochytrium sp. JEL0797]|nr:hypothetical protein HDU98_004978 [Podochytrium sp. JEL0797]